MPSTPPSIVCFGEILWDILPRGRFPGGAPFNVGFHLHAQGADVLLASAVGCDEFGNELLSRLRSAGIPTAGITRHADLPTGTVHAKVAPEGDAQYQIVENVAWDRIELNPAVLAAAAKARAIIFGSLAQRSTYNRNSLDELLEVADPEAWRVFDINLRSPHDDLALAGLLASRATLLKLNSAEAARLATGADERPGREEQDARRLQSETGCRLVCVTAGARGAGILADGKWYWETGRAVAVADTVGAGDAFLATLLLRLLEAPKGVQPALTAACRMGEWVATQPGATPAYGPSTPR